MASFLVRDRDSRRAVGLFAAEDLEDLVCLVSEVADPAACEFALIGSGAIVWNDASIRVPDPNQDWARPGRSPLDVVGPHGLGGAWAFALFDDTLGFMPCVAEATTAANDP